MKKLKSWSIIICCIYCLNACTAAKQSNISASIDINDSLVGEKLNREQRTYLDATKAKVTGDIPEAINLFNECLQINENNAAAHYQLSKIYIESNKNEAALVYIKNAIKLEPNNKWYQVQYAEALSINGKYKEAAMVYDKQILNWPNEELNYFNAAYLYQKANKPDEALRVLNSLENQIGVKEELILQKQPLLIQQGKINDAALDIEKLITNKPYEIKYYTQLIELYQKTNQTEKEIATYERMSKNNIADDKLHVALANFYFKKHDIVKYKEEVNQCIKSKTLSLAEKLNAVSPYLAESFKDNSLTPTTSDWVNQLIELHPASSQLYAIKGDLFTAQLMTNEALIAYKKSIAIDNTEFAVWQQCFTLSNQLKQYDSLIAISLEGQKIFPDQALCYYFNGIGNSQKNNITVAAKSFKQALPRCGDNTDLKAQVYAAIGEMWHAQKKYEASDSAFQQSILLNPNDAFTLNNYAYYLSLRQTLLPLAESYSKQSNELQQKNASFQDTYAWILYQQKKYNDALVWIEKSIANGASNSGVVMDHYGDIVFRLGNTDKAIEKWVLAKQLGCGNIYLTKKIAEKTIYE
jgi:tetratricopeptide (TPR) repeat protein